MARGDSRSERLASARGGRPERKQDKPNFLERSFNFVMDQTVDRIPVKIPTVFAFIPSPIQPIAVMQRRTDVGRIAKNAATQARDIVVGLPAGVQAMVSDPIGTAKEIGKAYADLYGPLLRGDLQTFGDRVSEQPLSPILDALAVVSGGAGAAVRVGGAVGKGGQISRAAKVAKARQYTQGNTIEQVYLQSRGGGFVGKAPNRLTTAELKEFTEARAAYQLAKDYPNSITIRLRNLGNPDGKRDIFVNNPAGPPILDRRGRTNPVSREAQHARSKFVTFTSELAYATARTATTPGPSIPARWKEARAATRGVRAENIAKRDRRRANTKRVLAAMSFEKAQAKLTPDEAKAFGVISRGTDPVVYAALIRSQITDDLGQQAVSAKTLSDLDSPAVQKHVADYYESLAHDLNQQGQTHAEIASAIGRDVDAVPGILAKPREKPTQLSIVVDKGRELAHYMKEIGVENGVMSLAEATVTPYTALRAIAAGGRIGLKAKQNFQAALRGRHQALVAAAVAQRKTKSADKSDIEADQKAAKDAKKIADEKFATADEKLKQSRRADAEAKSLVEEMEGEYLTLAEAEATMRAAQTRTRLASNRKNLDPKGDNVEMFHQAAQRKEREVNDHVSAEYQAHLAAGLAENAASYEIHKIIELHNAYDAFVDEQRGVQSRIRVAEERPATYQEVFRVEAQRERRGDRPLEDGARETLVKELEKAEKVLENKIARKAQQLRGAYARFEAKNGPAKTEEAAKVRAAEVQATGQRLRVELSEEIAEGTRKRGKHQPKPWRVRFKEQIAAQKAWEIQYNKVEALHLKQKKLELESMGLLDDIDKMYISMSEQKVAHLYVEKLGKRMDELAEAHQKFMDNNAEQRAVIKVERKKMQDTNPSYWIHGPGALLDENLPEVARRELRSLLDTYGPDIFEARELGGSIPELRNLARRGYPFYLPDKLAVKFNQGGQAVLNQGIATMMGEVALNPSLLTAEYMNMVRTLQHREMMTYLKSQHREIPMEEAMRGELPAGWRIVDSRVNERQQYVANFKHTSDADIMEAQQAAVRAQSELDVADLETPGHVASALFDLSENYFAGQTRADWIVTGKPGAEMVTIAPKLTVENMAREARRQNTFTKALIEKPLTVWRTIVLGTRPAFLVNNMIGNHFLYAVEWAGADGLAGLMDMILANTTASGRRGTPEAMDALVDAGFGRLSMGEKLVTVMANGFFPTSVGGRSAFGSTQSPLGRRKLDSATFTLPSVKRNKDGNRVGQRRRTITMRGLGLGVIPITQAFAETGLRQAAMFAELRGAAKSAGLIGRMERTKNVLRRLGMMSGETVDFNRLFIRMLENDPKLQRRVADSVLEDLGNYFDLGTIERHYVRQAAPFYSWYKAIMSITLRMPFDHPAKSTMLRGVAAVGIEQTMADGEVPSYLLGHVDLRPGFVNAIPGIGTIAGREPILTTNGINPFHTVSEVGEAIIGLSGLGGADTRAGLAAAAQLSNPFGTALIEEITGRSILTGGRSTTVTGTGFQSYFERVLRQLPPAKLITAAFKGDVTEPTYLFEKTFGKEFFSQLGLPVRNMSPEVAKKLAKEERTRSGEPEKKRVFGWNEPGS